MKNVRYSLKLFFTVCALSLVGMACNPNFETFSYLNPTSATLVTTPTPSGGSSGPAMLSIPAGLAIPQSFATYGKNPSGDLLLVGNTLYGLTQNSGTGSGIIFSMAKDGSHFKVLHNFDNLNDGANPVGSLIISGSILYGFGTNGGINDSGTIFSYDLNSSTFSVLYSFTGGADGSNPSGSPVMVGSVIYGLAGYGGVSSNGTLFSFDTSNSSFTNLYSFTGGADGANPLGSLTLSGTTLYSMTDWAGTGGAGTIFSYDLSSSTFTTLYSFTGGVDGGEQALGNLTISGSVLYGMTPVGGVNGVGNIFSFDTSNSTFTTLYSFTDGGNPYGSLLLSGGTLYGLNSYGGVSGFGNIFSFDIASSTYSSLYEFNQATDGSVPLGSLILSGSVLYGFTDLDGPTNFGAAFSFDTSNSTFAVISTLSDQEGYVPTGALALSGNTFFGATNLGGANHYGTLFSVGVDGTNYQLLHTFSGGSDGENPTGSLIVSGTTLYGMATNGGAHGFGTIYSMQTDGSNFSVLYAFTALANGGNPGGGLTLANGKLYGLAQGGQGKIFSIGLDGSNYTILYALNGVNDGRNPVGTLALSGSTLFGMTNIGGTSNAGSIFRIDTDGSNYSVIYSFTGAGDGDSPHGSPIISGNTLYGTTFFGGTNFDGVVFKVNLDGTNFATLHNFTGGADGRIPSGQLALSGNTLYGSSGVLFSVETDASNFTVISSTNASGDVTLFGNALVGTATGGTLGGGTVFEFGL